MAAGANTVRLVPRRSLHSDVLAALRDMIIEGELPAGERINETALYPQLGVSRTPLREALKALASEGLVELVPNRGAVVRRFTLDDVTQMLEAVKVIETFAARAACERATADEIGALKLLHNQMRACFRSEDRLEYFKLNQDIHSGLVRAGHNEPLAAMHTGLQARLKRIRYIGNEAPAKWSGAMAEHDEMMVALTARDRDALAEVVGRHMDETLKRVADQIEISQVELSRA
jgi:DNA-binding GntR family transcriptional regulator